MSGDAGTTDTQRLIVLSAFDRCVVLGASVAAFLLAVPASRWNPAELVGAIAWTYALIPVLVIAALAVRRRLGWRGVVLETVTVSCLKFAVTHAIMMLIWLLAGPDVPRPRRPLLAPPVEAPAEEPAPTEIPRSLERWLSGVVRDGEERGVAGAFVYVAAGLDDFTFAVPSDVLELTNDGGGPQPSEVFVRARQELELRALDGRLHTLQGTAADGRVGFNLPFVERRGEHRRHVAVALGPVVARCTVHPEEPPAYWLVLDHPHVTRTDELGRWRLERVPAGELIVAAWRPGSAAVSQRLDAPAGRTTSLRLRLD